MAMKIALCFAVLVAAVASAPHKAHGPHDVDGVENSRPNIPDSDIYNCTGHSDGNYNHPTDCTRFISCSNTRTFDMACGDCDLNNKIECDGEEYLVYRHSTDQCDWPLNTHCFSRETPPPVPETTAAPAPVPEPETETPPGDHWCTDGETTWHEGDSCTEEDCHPCGYCHDQVFYYLRCVHTIPSDPRGNVTGVVVREECEDLYWNPDHEGGSCDFWTGLSPTWQDHWEADARCDIARDVCKWGQEDDDECSGKHWYYEPKVGTTPLTCPEDLLWHQASEGCQPFYKPVTRANGTNCPC